MVALNLSRVIHYKTSASLPINISNLKIPLKFEHSDSNLRPTGLKRIHRWMSTFLKVVDSVLFAEHFKQNNMNFKLTW